MFVKEILLSNRIKSTFIKNSSSSTITILILLKIGSRYEKKKELGVAHFFEHVVFKGTEKYHSAKEITYLIESLGGEINAFTAKEYMGFYIRTQERYFELSLDILSQLIFAPLLRKEDIEKEKQVILQEIRTNDDLPQRRVFRHFEKNLFKTGLKNPILGTEQSILRINQELIKDYISKFFIKDNIRIIISGNAEESDIRKGLNKYFSFNFPSQKKKFKEKKEKDLKPVRKSFKEKLKTQQAHFVFGLKTVSMYNKKKYVFMIISALLAQGMSSFLFEELREKRGWAYYISSLASFFTDSGLLAIYGDLKDDKDVLVSSFNIIKEKLLSLQKNIDYKEFKRAKEYVKGNFLLGLETNFDKAYYYGKKSLFFDKVDSPNKIINQLSSVEIDDVKTVAKNFFKEDRFCYAVISSLNNLPVLL